MNFKDKCYEFFTKFKRGIISFSVCGLALAVVCAVAIKTNNIEYTNENSSTVNTSSQGSINFISPIENGKIIKDFSNTELKYNSTLKQWESHKAIDFQAGDDANVLAVYGGEVISIKTTYLNGTVVVIKHTDSLQTVYGSLDENVSVQVGDKVKQGQIIGKVSSSAKNESFDGNHLHFEVLLNGVKVDPNLYLESSDK